MRKAVIIISILFFAGLTVNSSAEDKTHSMDEGSHHKMHSVKDERISLGLSPAMKQHQLANMRNHVEAVQSIIGLLSEGAFDKASHIAYSKLGLTKEMEKMCNNFENENFKNLGLAFHKSGDALGATLKTKDLNKSLGALHTTMSYCVQCHATFRQ
ncbi:MAG: cytochrome C [Nitrospina sp.]|jgi:hypothetical protein|nr:cytochrome C [Nitrospina sp.]MBT4374927.1 cytochrome C [Nitrospina sp.]MBT6596045.1 cytochrome C [Nitrospina sp.]MBT7934929.1 cytochrome C [Nitrospina sp.]